MAEAIVRKSGGKKGGGKKGGRKKGGKKGGTVVVRGDE